MVMRCGVLALQGDWAAHAAVLSCLGLEPIAVRTPEQLTSVDALVLPGGESTAMLRLMEAADLFDPLADRIRDGLPVLGTCAGTILLASASEPSQPTFGVLDIDVARNAYGRQVHSRVAGVDLEPELGEPRTIDGVFIRAPRITRIGAAVAVLGRCDDDVVVVRQGNVVAATFHPELTDDRRIHRLLIREGDPP